MTLIKEIRETYTENTAYGQLEVNYLKRFQHHEIKGRTYQRETTYKNGICTYSADYPANTEYARNQLEGRRTA